MASDRWRWDEAAHRYRDLVSGQFLSPSTTVGLRDDFIARQRAWADDLARMVASGDMSVQRWELEMRERVRLVWTTQYLLGRGGRNAMTAEDRAALGGLVRDQYEYLHGFAADLARGDLTEAQIRSRSQLYFDAATHAHGRGQAGSYAGLRLPAYPGDGSSECLANCRCSWSLDETADEYRATWKTSTEESCETCERRGRDWAPLVVAKEDGDG